MATSAELERLKALLTRLMPLTQTERGELIRADDWNTIVSTLIEIGRAVYAEVQSQEVPEHTHIDEVSIGWLDSALSNLVNGGSLNDPIQQSKLNAQERKISQLDRKMGDLKNEIQGVLGIVDRVATRDLIREKTFHGLDQRVDGLHDARNEVNELRQTLQGINKQITIVQTIGDHLRDASGEIIKISELRDQVIELSTIREQLKDANGQFITGLSIDKKIAGALNNIITKEQLTDSLDNRFEGLDKLLDNDLDSKISFAIDERINSTLNDFRTSVESNISKQLEDLDSRIQETIDKEFPRLENRMQLEIKTELEQNRKQLDILIKKQVAKDFETRIRSGELLSKVNRDLLAEELTLTVENKVTDSFKELGLTDELIGIDDFTALTGIGATYHNRLQTAKVKSYTDLANSSPEKISKITNLSVDRINELDVIGQAKLKIDGAK